MFTVAFIGCGAFARFFVPLFKIHPAVKKVYVCDLIAQKAEKYSADFGVEIIPTFEEALSRRDIDAVAIFTQRHTHGPLVRQALEAGKHVYSAVPMASDVEDCMEITRLVRKTGLIYMMGETCIYYPCALFCRREFEKGTFGKFVYGEAQYYHDFSHFSENFRSDRPSSAVPPFYYPTHSTSMLLYATSAHVLRVSAVGYRDTEENTPFAEGENLWDNPFSDEFSLMQLSNGGTARINECRRIGWKAPSSSISAFYGTKGGYQFSNAQHVLTRLTAKGVELADVSAEVNPAAMTEANDGTQDFKNRVANHMYQGDSVSPVQREEYARIPQALLDFPRNGHMASHKLLVDDFCRAVRDGRQPPVDAWKAARYTIPGLIAHRSAMQGGVLLDVPDCGDGIDG